VFEVRVKSADPAAPDTAAGDAANFVKSNASLTATISQPRQLGDGVYQLRAALTPPALGHVDAVVKVDGADIEVVLTAHTAIGHQELAGHLDQLRQALSQGTGGDVRLTLSDRGTDNGRSGTRYPPAPSLPSTETPRPGEHVLVATPSAPAGSSLHIIL
jgi:hypothetical protein